MYREHLKVQVSCRECGELMAKGSLTSTLMTQHGMVAETRWRWKTPANGGRATDFQNDLPVEGRPAELPGGGIPRTSDNKEGDTGPFYAPACPGHRGNFGGGKPPAPTVPPMRHAGPLSYTERKAPCHRTVRQGSGAKEAAVIGGGFDGEHGDVI